MFVTTQRLKRNREDDGVSKKTVMDAGVSILVLDSLTYVVTFQNIDLKNPWKDTVSQIGDYIHKNWRLGTPFPPQNQFMHPGSVSDK